MTTASVETARQGAAAEATHDISRVIGAFADTISDILYVLDSDGRLVWCNRHVEKVTGVLRQQLISKSKLDLILTEDRSLVIQATQAAGDSDDIEFEARVLTTAGPVPYHFKSVALRDSDGRPVGRVGVARDISERKRAAEALLRENAFVRLLQSIATVANGAETVEEAFQFAVDRICAHTGWPVGHVYKREEVSHDFVSTGIWSSETSALFKDFREVTEATRFGSETGIAGWVAATGKAAWITDVTRQPKFVRAKLAKRTGLRSGFAFPVLVGDEIVAVLEFFSTEVEEPDDKLLEVMAHVGTQLGRVIERKRAEEQLQRSEDRSRNLVESSPDALVVYSGGGVISVANEAAARLVGAKSPDDLIGLTVWDFVHPDDRELIRERGRLLAEGEELPLAELRFVRLDGEPLYVESVARPITYEGQPAVQVSARNITERRRIQTELRGREKQLKHAQRLAQLGYWQWDVLEDKVTGSDELCEMFGLSPDEFAAKFEAYRERVHPEDREQAIKAIESARADLKPFTFEQRIVRPDATFRVLSCLGEVEAGADGKAVRMTGVCQDITQKKRAEDILARQLRDLERTRQDLEQFAYVASHDLQEPLRMVSSYVQLLERRYKGRLDNDADDFIQFAVDGAKRMQELINDLLAYSRVGTRGKPFQPTDLDAAVDGVLASDKQTLDGAHAIVTRDSLPAVVADSSQVEQLYTQLIGNAVKFCNGRRPRIHIGVEEREGERTFFVRDNGIGIDPQFADRIFTIFQRLHGREQYPGTGMGLAICKRIVERRGGRIWVESKPGKGSTFCFTIPQIEETKE